MNDTTNGPKGLLGWVERMGNKLPDPVFMFLGLIGLLIAFSAAASWLGWSALHPTQTDASGAKVAIKAVSLLDAERIRRLWVEMPQTFTHFHPLGYVLVVMLGAGVAERSGLFSAAMRQGVRAAPIALLTPAVAFVAMMGNLAADAAYVCLFRWRACSMQAPGATRLRAVAAFAGVSGLRPTCCQASLTRRCSASPRRREQVVPTWDANIAGNWYFIATMLILFLPVIWWITDKVIEPRLKRFTAPDAEAMKSLGNAHAPLAAEQRRGLWFACAAALAVGLLWVLFLVVPGTPLIDEQGRSRA
jgi:aminobenzoyl-glutamate transport protein